MRNLMEAEQVPLKIDDLIGMNGKGDARSRKATAAELITSISDTKRQKLTTQ